MLLGEAGAGGRGSGPALPRDKKGDGMKEKKVYEKPALRKVRLEVKNSVLSSCHTSTATNSMTPGCLVQQCFYRTP